MVHVQMLPGGERGPNQNPPTQINLNSRSVGKKRQPEAPGLPISINEYSPHTFKKTEPGRRWQLREHQNARLQEQS